MFCLEVSKESYNQFYKIHENYIKWELFTISVIKKNKEKKGNSKFNSTDTNLKEKWLKLKFY